jgi:hypothetical protein
LPTGIIFTRHHHEKGTSSLPRILTSFKAHASILVASRI